ncbi:MAG TPA: type VI secretion system-associated FHA domain protein TagH [Steroidobacteraceae bacterium]|nr:type VI secretion system-associated FHA domain protein TagH [Steroidobacteraceae bacterium]
MYLTLEIMGEAAARFGSQRRHTFDIEGGRIGRAPDNEWVIPDQYIHSVHAVVRYMSGLFFIEKRGQNRVAVNRPDADLSPNEPFPIKNGDKLFIDEYELSVSVTQSAPAPAPVVAPTVSLQSLDPITGPRRSDPLVAPVLESLDPGDLDPLRHMSPRSPQRPADQPLPSMFTHGSVLTDSFHAPGLTGAAQGGGGAILPDDWDKTSFSRGAAAPSPAPPPPPRQASMPPAYVPPRTAPPQAPPGNELQQFALALGLQPNELQSSDAAALGRALRNCLAGLIELLQVRGEIRARFRVALTQTAARDPNPLKRAPNIEDAVHELFRRRQAGALPVDAALADALEEARCHQLAMLDAMRGAFDALIERLDPQRQAEAADATGRRGALGLPGRARHWENYLEYFAEQVGADHEEAFRRLFGANFAKAYEQALDRQRRMARQRRAP